MLKVLKERVLEVHDKPTGALLRMGFANADDLSYVNLGHKMGTAGVGIEFRQKVYALWISK